MTPIHVERVARKRYECAWDCDEWIEPGTRYVRSSLPPRTDPNESDQWWTQALHGHTRDSCPKRNGHALAAPVPDNTQETRDGN